MTHLASLNELSQQIKLLASVEESDGFFVSCYLSLDDRSAVWLETLDERARILRRILQGNALADFEESMNKIEVWLATELLPEARSAAVFVRGTFAGAFFLPMQFSAPLPNWVAVYPTPNIYHLMELKDNYHCYVVLLAMTDRVCILEVNLGASTMQAWADRSELRVRVGSEWTRTHYQVNQAQRGDQFIPEKIAILEQLMNAGGHTHLILAGEAELTEQIRRVLPNDLLSKLVDVIPVGERDHESDVVMATLSSFLEHEEQESRSIAERLVDGLRRQTLAVGGSAATLDALHWGEVDTLVIASAYRPDPGWFCKTCRAIGVDTLHLSECSRCGESSVGPVDLREAMVRLAGQLGRPVEVVEHSDELMALGGVGCLLRTHLDTKRAHDGSQFVARERPILQASLVC